MSEQHSTELWKPIDGFPGYEVSDQGRVRSNRAGINQSTQTGKLRVLKPCLNTFTGYLQTVFCVNWKKTGHRIHTLVAEAFIGPVPVGMTVNHRNGIKTDNRVENLEIASPRDQNLHAYAVLGRKRPKPEHIIRDVATGRIMGTLKH